MARKEVSGEIIQWRKRSLDRVRIHARIQNEFYYQERRGGPRDQHNNGF